MSRRRLSRRARYERLALEALAILAMAAATSLIVCRLGAGQARASTANGAGAANPGPGRSDATAAASRRTASATSVSTPWEDAEQILTVRPELTPGDLPAGVHRRAAVWPAWVARRNEQIRGRLVGGDEDSVVNLWLFGTSFTTLPRVTGDELATAGEAANLEQVVSSRLTDLVSHLAAPDGNERLQFAREVLDRRGIDPTTRAGRAEARAFLVEQLGRVLEENARNRAERASARLTRDPGAERAAYAAFYRTRGLSSDTKILAGFAVEHALLALESSGRLGAGSVRRAAVVGPGLDVADKAEGYDFYPIQTIQPFALVDSLVRAGLSVPGDLQVTTFDVSPRVNSHIAGARERARAGEPYVLHLPLESTGRASQLRPALEQYWQRMGDRIGDEVPAMPAPPHAGPVRVRAVRVRPDVALSIAPRDLNVVLERLAPLEAPDRFDLIVATNVLVYHEAFDQALALSNIAAMLARGGYFLTNTPIPQSATMALVADHILTVDFDDQRAGDTMFWYQRR